jgi:hypothetical protein
MEQQYELLQQTLIKKYSKLTGTSEDQLTVNLKDADWWKKEPVLLKKRQKRNIINITIVLVSFGVVVASAIFTMSISQHVLNTSYFSLIAVCFAFIPVHMSHLRHEERIQLFEIMQLAFENPETRSKEGHLII